MNECSSGLVYGSLTVYCWISQEFVCACAVIQNTVLLV